MTAADAIELEGVSKRYREVLAVDRLDLRVRRGEIYGFLGRNGAGKTTTIRLMLGLIRPTAGSVRLAGRDLAGGRERALAAVGSLVESAASYPNLTVRENLEIQRRLTRSPAGAVERAIAALRLEAEADRRAGRLSLGNRQRLALARALLAGPAILVLDEPANGLDPAGIAEIRELLRRLSRERGVTVFLSSHILGEVAQLADRIGIIHRGRLVEELEGGAAPAGGARIEATVSDAARAAAVLAGSLGLKWVTASGPRTLSIGDEGCRPADVARAIVGAGLELERLCRVEDDPLSGDLEGRFMRLTGGEA